MAYLNQVHRNVRQDAGRNFSGRLHSILPMNILRANVQSKPGLADSITHICTAVKDGMTKR